MTDFDDLRECMDPANELLPWYLNGTLGPAERAQVEAHLGGCDICRRELAELSELAEAMSRHVGPAAVPGLDESVVASDPGVQRPVKASRTGAAGWAIAASVALLAMLGIVAYLRRGPWVPATGGSAATESMAVLDLGSGPARSAAGPTELAITETISRVELLFQPPIDGPNDYEVRLLGPNQIEVQAWTRGPLALDTRERARVSVEATRLPGSGDYQLVVRHFGDAGEAREYIYPFRVAIASSK